MTAAQAAGVRGGLRGCLSTLELDGRRIGLPDVLETNSIESGCLWQYACDNRPCIDGATCVQEGLSGFKCLCDFAQVCTKNGFQDPGANDTPMRPIAVSLDSMYFEVQSVPTKFHSYVKNSKHMQISLIF